MSESILKKAFAAIASVLKDETKPEEPKGYFSEEVKAVILDTFEKQDVLMKRFDDGEIDGEEADRELRRLERDRLRRQIDAELRTAIAKDARAFPAPASAPEVVPEKEKLRRFKFDGRLAWAWEVENSVADAGALNELLEQNKAPAEEGQKLAEHLFSIKAARAKGEEFREHIDEDGADILLPNLPYSPYTDEGAAFMVSLVYAWRGMAEEWNLLEREERKSARARKMEEERLYLDKMMEERTRDILAKMAEKEKGDSAIDARGFAKIFETNIVSAPESTGLSKIAAGIAAGDLKKSKF